MNDVVNAINRQYVRISNRVTKAYERVFSLKCDIYFPVFPEYNKHTLYRDMKIFAPHQSPSYRERPDLTTKFYIPLLIKKEAMNSSELEFDSFYTESEIDRPFIETSKKRELPIATKVVVYQDNSILKFFIDKKLVVTGADGFMLLRMYLSPLAKDNDGDIEDQEESMDTTDEEQKEEVEEEKRQVQETVETQETSKRRTPRKRSTKKSRANATVIEVENSDLQMNIPDD